MLRKKDEATPSERLASALSLPKEVVCNLPEITMTGNKTLMVENHKGIIDCGEELLRLNTLSGILTVKGHEFDLLTVTDEVIVLSGSISAMEFTE